MRPLLILCMLLCMGLAGIPAWSAPADLLELRLVLHDAATFAGPVAPGSPAMLIDLQRVGDRWESGFSTSAAYGNTEREVRVDAANVGPDAMRFDLWAIQATTTEAPGERFRYQVSLKKAADGSFTGTYTGTVRGANITGQAEGQILPTRTVRAGFVPVQPGEHPRLLFRKADLPALRAKADTPFGKVALARLPDNAASLALRYQLTGDRALADEARKRVALLMEDRSHGDKRVRSRWFGYRIEIAALAYDMCYDAWDAAFRQEVAEYLLEQADILFYHRGPGIFDSHIAWALNSSHSVPVIYGAGFAGLALWGEKSPAPAQPEPRFSIKSADPLIAPAQGYTPGAGVVPADLQSGVMPQNWIYAGAFPEGRDDLAALGGMAGARPFVGQRVKSGDMTTEFKPLVVGKGYYSDPKYTNGRTVIEISGPAGVVQFSSGYFYSVIRNDKERWVRYDPAQGAAPCYLNGQRLSPGEVVHLQPGLYPWMVLGPITSLKPWGKTFMEPRLFELTAAEAKAALDSARAEFDEKLADWKLDIEEWTRTGGCDPRFLHAYARSRYIMYLSAREVPGTGGVALPGEHMLTIDGLNKYACAHMNVFGTSFSPFEDITAVLPYKEFVHTFRADGKQLGLELSGPAGFTGAYYPDNSPNTTGDQFAALFPTVRDEWKPTVLWAWNTLTGGGLQDEASMAKIASVGGRGGYSMTAPYGSFVTYPLYAFVNYPLNMAPKAPQGNLPLTWQAPDAGFYGFRNNYAGTDDECITQFYSQTRGGGSGSLRIIGLGNVWSHGINAAATERYGENVVQLPENVINENADGKVTYLKTEADGSGSISINLNDVYSAPKVDDNDRAEALYEKYGSYRRPQAFVDQGITGMRAMAVDYSGKSGAPCLIVLVDKIQGGGKKLWAWQLESKTQAGPPTTRVNADVKENILFDGKQFTYKIGQLLKLEVKQIANDPMVKVGANGFTLTQGAATLQATFVTPAMPKVELAQRTEWRQGVKSGVAQNSSKAIFAEGDNFFVVMTLQQGPAPAVKVEGTGLNARVTVGQRVITFDGEKIVLGE